MKRAAILQQVTLQQTQLKSLQDVSAEYLRLLYSQPDQSPSMSLEKAVRSQQDIVDDLRVRSTKKLGEGSQNERLTSYMERIAKLGLEEAERKLELWHQLQKEIGLDGNPINEHSFR